MLLSTTPSLLLLIVRVTLWVGQQPVVPVSVVLANPLRSQLRLQQSVALKP
ncbi:30S ribosomal protein S11 [Enterobacter sp. OLF]|nr:30S ribosomal protein S11 [Enterobacter sp. OLF]